MRDKPKLQQRRKAPTITKTEINVIKNTLAMAKRVTLRTIFEGKRVEFNPDVYGSFDRYVDTWIAAPLVEFKQEHDDRIKYNAQYRYKLRARMVELLRSARNGATLTGWHHLEPQVKGLRNEHKQQIREFVNTWFWVGLNIVICNIEDRRNGKR